jgi:hypothetical protein
MRLSASESAFAILQKRHPRDLFLLLIVWIYTDRQGE